MLKLTEVMSYIETHQERFVTELCDLLRIPSVTDNPNASATMADALANCLRRIDFSADVFPSGGNPVVVADKSAATSGPSVLIYGHYDVMPAGEAEAWSSDPFTPTLRDGRIYARGAGDNKGQHFAHIKALEALQACGIAVPPVKFLIEGNEESGSNHLVDCLVEHRERLAADLCFAADGPRDDSNRPTIYLGCRGLLGFELSVSGPREDLHSGNRGNIVPNPAWRLVQCLASLRDGNGRVLIDGFASDALPPTDVDRTLIRALPYDGGRLADELGVVQLASRLGSDHFEALMFQPTLNINGLLAGHAAKGIKTIIPARARAKLDIRMVAGQTAERMVEALRAHLVLHGFEDVELAVRTVMAPSRTPADHPFVSDVVASARQATGVEPVIYPVLGGSIPLHAFTGVLGTPCVWCAYANSDEQNHAPNENIRIDCFMDGIKTTAALLARLGAQEV